MPSSTPASFPGLLYTSLFATPTPLYVLAFALRIFLLLYGLWQDANSPLKYTDIDYLVFTDAARVVAHHHPLGPYARETYRYTPLLSWLLLPTTWTSSSRSHWVDVAYFSFGKILFAAADLLAGWLIERVLTMRGGGSAMAAPRARAFAAIWLLNPMAATISTRGSSEGLLAVLVMALLWATLARHVSLAAVLLGVGVHFKIYPFIYAPAIVWWMDDARMKAGAEGDEGAAAGKAGVKEKSPSQQVDSSIIDGVAAFLTADRLKLALLSMSTFGALNIAMYALYGHPFLLHTFLHHVRRIDHRHNFSPYNILLYLSSAATTSNQDGFRIESVAFLPQLLLSCVLIPVVMAKKDLPAAMLAQTWAFVAFNKVCTSQYFLWYLVLLPLYLPHSSFLHRPRLGVAALALWILTQAAWLQQGFQLEFLGETTFVPGLWLSALGFFLANCWILGVVVGDVA
ncbi:GPI mannosyltransferase 1 [Gnomoniopsis smithogilvyi]|uniref:GPI mannosyltransferase 1 n=1 Tax=Gnomoniopsis smithogilvyi TaxID=1191159 RepID=A0A9W8YXW7_9PEZI|nr:GPI mannosyltransferase 1 [Gnomoniopsis smithogilvyi]